MAGGFGEGFYSEGGYSSFQYVLEFEAGVVTLAGQNAEFTRGYRLAAQAASAAVTGLTVEMLRGRRVVAGAGAALFDSPDASAWRRTYLIAPVVGAYAFSSPNVLLRNDRQIYADGAATLVFTEFPADIRTDRQIAAGAVSYAFSTAPANLLFGHRLDAGARSYAFTSHEVAFPITVFVYPTGQDINGDQGDFAFDTQYSMVLASQLLTATLAPLPLYGWVVDLSDTGNWTDVVDPSSAWVVVDNPAPPNWQ